MVGRSRALAGFAAIAALLFTACGGSSSGSGAKSPIKIGYLAPLTGGSAAPGQSEKNGWELGIKDFGNSVDGHPIQTNFLDTQGDPNVALSDARELVTQDNIDLLEGPLLANEQAAVWSYIGPQGIPVDDISECGYAQWQDYLKYGTGFSSGWTCNQPDIMAADYLYNDLHITHVTTLGADYAFGWLSIGGFIAEFKKDGGTIDKTLWAPITTSDYGPYVSSIPKNTGAVFAVTVGNGGPTFTSAYYQFGLKDKIPLFGNTTLTDYSVLPGENPSAITGIIVGAQYCDGINTSINQTFANEYHAAYGSYPGYYADAAYTKARLAITALKKLNGVSTNHKKLIAALKSTSIVSSRGPVKLSPVTLSPIQNIYICKVESVNGALRNVPIKTYNDVQPWGTLGETAWKSEYQHASTGRPSA